MLEDRDIQRFVDALNRVAEPGEAQEVQSAREKKDNCNTTNSADSAYEAGARKGLAPD